MLLSTYGCAVAIQSLILFLIIFLFLNFNCVLPENFIKKKTGTLNILESQLSNKMQYKSVEQMSI